MLGVTFSDPDLRFALKSSTQYRRSLICYKELLARQESTVTGKGICSRSTPANTIRYCAINANPITADRYALVYGNCTRCPSFLTMFPHLSPTNVNIRRSDMVPLKPCLLEEIHWRIFTNPFGKVFFFSRIFHEPFFETNFLRADRSSCWLCVSWLQLRDVVVFSHDAYTTFSEQVAMR